MFAERTVQPGGPAPDAPDARRDGDRQVFVCDALGAYDPTAEPGRRLTHLRLAFGEAIDRLPPEEPQRWIDSIARGRFVSPRGTEYAGRILLKDFLAAWSGTEGRTGGSDATALRDTETGLLARFGRFVRESRGVEIVWNRVPAGGHVHCGDPGGFPAPADCRDRADRLERVLAEVLNVQFGGVTLAMDVAGMRERRYGPTEREAVTGDELLELYAVARWRRDFPKSKTRPTKVLKTEGYTPPESLLRFLQTAASVASRGEPHRAVTVPRLADFLSVPAPPMDLVEAVLLDLYRTEGAAGGTKFSAAYLSGLVCRAPGCRDVLGTEILAAYSRARYLADHPDRRDVRHDKALATRGYGVAESLAHFRSNLGMDLVIAEAVALLHGQPLLLYRYLRIHHPEFDVQAARRVSARLLKGFEPPERPADEAAWPETLPRPAVTAVRCSGTLRELVTGPAGDALTASTDSRAVFISGYVPAGGAYLDIDGAYRRRVTPAPDGYFEAALPLPDAGRVNTFVLRVRDPRTGEQSAPQVVSIGQEGEGASPNEAFVALVALRSELARSVLSDEVRYRDLCEATELALLGDFTASEAAGFRRLEGRIAAERSEAQRTLLAGVLDRFRQVSAVTAPGFREGESLFFYQKYAIWWTRNRFRSGVGGVMHVLDQGLGKTPTVLALVRDSEATYIAPNGVVSTWVEQEGKFFQDRKLKPLGGAYAERDLAVANPSAHLVVNKEYTRSLTGGRKAGLSKPDGYLVIDEGSYLGYGSDQAQGTALLDARRRILLSATPAVSTSQLRHILHFLHPGDPRYSSARAFKRSFPPDDPEALRALYLLVEECSLRLRKDQLFQPYDPARPLAEQRNRLPRKHEVQPERFGRFTLHPEQCRAIHLLFTDPGAWYRRYRAHADPSGDAAVRGGFFSLREALRQATNDPAYCGLDVPSPKHAELDRIVGHELRGDPGMKFLVFSRYRSQVETYSARYAAHGVCPYYGGLPRDHDGYMVGADGGRSHFRVGRDGEFELDTDGCLIPAAARSGRPIGPLDYQRRTFQSSRRHQFMFATYDSGSVGVTLTAAGVWVADDLARSSPEEDQAMERVIRPDNEPSRKRYECRFYRLVAEYDPGFLADLPDDVRETYFAMGTFDRVQLEKLGHERRLFKRLFDGIGSEDEVIELEGMVKRRMPFLFQGLRPAAEGTPAAIEASGPALPQPSAPAQADLAGEFAAADPAFLSALIDFAHGEFPVEELGLEAEGAAVPLPSPAELVEHLIERVGTEHVVSYLAHGEPFAEWFDSLPPGLRQGGVVAVHRVALGEEGLAAELRRAAFATVRRTEDAAFLFRNADGGWHAVQFRDGTVAREGPEDGGLGLTVRAAWAAEGGHRPSFQSALPLLRDAAARVVFREVLPPSARRIVVSTGTAARPPPGDARRDPVRALRLLLPTLKTPDDWTRVASLYERARPFISSYLNNRAGLRLLAQLSRAGRFAMPESILSVCAGTGDLFEAAGDLRLPFVVTDLDSSEGMLRLSRNPRRVLGDARNLPFAGTTFDAVECSAVADIATPDGRAGMVDEAHRVLKPGGALLLKVDGVYFGERWPHALKARGFELLTPVNAQLSLAGPPHASTSDALLEEMAEAFGKARFVVAVKAGDGRSCPAEDLSLLRTPTPHEDIRELRDILWRLSTPAGRSHEAYRLGAAAFRDVVSGMAAEDRRESLHTLVRIFDVFLHLTYLSDETKKASARPAAAELERYVQRFRARLDADLQAVGGPSDEAVAEWLTVMREIAGALGSPDRGC